MKRLLVLSIILGLWLTACGGANVPDDDTQPQQNEESKEPIIVKPGDDLLGDPDSGQAEWLRENALVQNAQLIVMESYPIQVTLEIEGELPTPCHRLMVHFNEPDSDNKLEVEVYSLVHPSEICIQVIEPFSERISFPTEIIGFGSYSVFVNGTFVGSITYPGG